MFTILSIDSNNETFDINSMKRVNDIGKISSNSVNNRSFNSNIYFLFPFKRHTIINSRHDKKDSYIVKIILTRVGTQVHYAVVENFSRRIRSTNGYVS